MGLNDVVFNRGQGGLGRPLSGEDHYSGMVVYNNTLPSGFSSSAREKIITSVSAAEELGITDDHADETKATGTYLVTAIGSNGDTVELKVAEPGGVISLGVTTKTSSETTVDLLAAAIAATINAGTLEHGYTASVNTATVTITARPGLGIFLNSGTPITTTIVGTITGTITQFSGGVASKLDVYHYHISEFFRKQPKGILYTGIYAEVVTYTFTELQTLQVFSGGKIRQALIYVDDTTFAVAQTTTIQSVITTLQGSHMPLNVIYAADIVGEELVDLGNLATLTNENVSVCIAQGFGDTAEDLFNASGVSITCGGALLGAVAFAKVSDDIAWVSKFDMSDGDNLEDFGFANGDHRLEVDDNTLSLLNDRRYIFLRKFVGYAGSFFNDDHTCVSISSDYAYISNCRVIDKAIRNIRAALLPDLNSPLVLNSDGTLTDNTVSYFESRSDGSLAQMVRDQELSDPGATGFTTIDTTQNVLATSTLTLSVKLLPIGVARNIVVNIGFTTSLS